MSRTGRLGAIWMASAIAISSIQTPSGPTIVSVYLEGTDLVMTPIDSIDWDKFVPPRLQPAAIAENPAFKQELFAKRGDYGSTEVPISVPSPPALLSRFYYLFDSAGVREIRPRGLKAIASVGWRGNSDSVDQVKAYGYVRLGATSNGGFVLVAPQRRTLKLEPSALTVDSLLGPNGAEYANKGTPFWKMLRQYQIRLMAPTQDRWVLVQWAPDSAGVEGGCANRFSLFHFQPAPVVVQSTDAGCDP